jgi:hypothetical protein
MDSRTFRRFVIAVMVVSGLAMLYQQAVALFVG